MNPLVESESKNHMATEKKPSLHIKTVQAFSRVLEQQSGSKRWGSTEHAACLGYLAEACVGQDGKFLRKDFFAILKADTELLYASNFKKALIVLEELEKAEVETGGYE